MPGEGRLIAVAAIIILLFVGVGVIQHGYWDAAVASEEQVPFNSTFTATTGTVNSISGVSNKDVAYAPQEDINVTQSGTNFAANGNWSWNRHNGTLDINPNSGLTDGANANVSGYWAVPNQKQNATKNIATLPVDAIGSEWQLMAGIMLVLLAAAVAAGVGRA